MISILLVIDSLVGAGAQRQITNLALGLDARGFKVSLFFYHPKYDFLDHFTDSNIDIIEHTKKGRFDLKPVIRLSNEIKERRPDVVIAFLRTPSIYCELIRLFNSGFKLIVSERISVIDDRLTKQDLLAGLLHSVADHVTSNSADYRNYLVSALPFLRKKISVIYNGAGDDFFTVESGRDKNSYGAKKVKFVVIASRCTEVKGAFILAQAVKMLVESDVNDFEVTWVGGINFTDPYVEKVVDFLDQNNLDTYWRWNGKSDNVLEILTESDVLISASLQEGISNVICEAMAAGLPVIVSDISDNSIIVENGTSGSLYPAGNTNALTSVMATYCEMTPETYKGFCERSQERAFELFHMSRMIDEWVALCNRLLHSRT